MSMSLQNRLLMLTAIVLIDMYIAIKQPDSQMG